MHLLSSAQRQDVSLEFAKRTQEITITFLAHSRSTTSS